MVSTADVVTASVVMLDAVVPAVVITSMDVLRFLLNLQRMLFLQKWCPWLCFPQKWCQG